MTHQQRSAAASLRRPLCRRYRLGIFDSLVVPLRDVHEPAEHRVHWALGWLSDGDCECLGAWTNAALRLPDMLADLKRRGVLRLQTVDARRLHRSTLAEIADTVIHPFVGELLAGAHCPAHMAPTAQLIAERVRGSLGRGIARHGSFESEAAVLDFMAASLQRAERRLDRERSIAKGRPRHEPGARTMPSGI